MRAGLHLRSMLACAPRRICTENDILHNICIIYIHVCTWKRILTWPISTGQLLHQHVVFLICGGAFTIYKVYNRSFWTSMLWLVPHHHQRLEFVVAWSSVKLSSLENENRTTGLDVIPIVKYAVDILSVKRSTSIKHRWRIVPAEDLWHCG